MDIFTVDQRTCNIGICDHQQKYKFQEWSLLKNYLQTECPGWVEDPNDEYTLNYVLVLLFSVVYVKGLFDEKNIFRIQCDLGLSKVFNRSAVYIIEIRFLVKRHLIHNEPPFKKGDSYPFLCVPEPREYVKRLFPERIPRSTLFLDKCFQSKEETDYLLQWAPFE